MTVFKPIGIGVVILAAQFTASAGELAVLRNGFTVRFERREQRGDVTRLYTRSGFVEIASAEIVSFEPDDEPPAVDLPAPAASVPPAQQISGPGNTSAAALAAAGPGSATVVSIVSTHGNPAPATLDEVVRDASNRHRLDPDFVNSVIKAESNFQTRAVSRKGAQGLMQLMPGTASQLGVTDPFDPRANVEGGTAYLSQLLDLYGNDAVKALAAYNAGPHRVDQYHGVPPYMETRAYVARIVRDYNAKKRAQMNAQSAAKTANQRKKKTPAATQPQQAGIAKAKKPA